MNVVQDRKRRPGRRWLFRLLVVFVALCIGLGLAEFVVRVAGLGTATLSRGTLHAFDPEAGWKCVPELDARYVQPGSFDVRVTTNERGLRDGAIPFGKPDGVKRVCILGDSFMWGYGVEDDELLAHLLQELVPGIETVNLGANGYSTVQELVRLETEGLLYSPDVVIVAFTWNDVASNADHKRMGRPIASVDEDGVVRILNRPVKKPWKSPTVQWLRHNSRLFNFIEFATETYKARASARRRLEEYQNRKNRKDGRPDRAPGKPRKEQQAPSSPVQRERDIREITVVDLFGPPSERCERGWRLFEALLGKIQDLAKASGARLILLNNTSREEVFPEILRYCARLTEQQAREFGLQSGRVGEKLAEISGRLDITFVDPTPVFLAHPDPESLYLVENGHWSAAGHRLVAEALAPVLADVLGD